MEKRYIEVGVADLAPYERNPRKNDSAVDAVAESMAQVGYITPIVIDENNVVLAGETRLKALKKRGAETAQVLRVTGLTEEQKKKYRLLDNKVGEIAEWDVGLLAEELAAVDFGEFDFGFDELVAAMDADGIAESPEDDFEPELPEEPVTKRGDVWQLGRHRLMCGDSTSAEDVIRLMGGNLADLLLTDPPYGISIEGGTSEHLTIQNDNLKDDDFRRFLREAFQCADAVMKQGAAFYIWHADTKSLIFRLACQDVGWQIRQCLIWNKNSLVLSRQDYHWKHEPCLYGWKDGAPHTWLSDRKQTTVLDFDRPNRSEQHPTIKPTALFDYQIRNSCPKGGNVLDLFNGSGTTIMACEQNGRTAYCAEIDPRYVDATIQRFERFTGQKAVLLNQL